MLELSEFLTKADPGERERLAGLSDTSIGYLRKLASTGECSTIMALRIEYASHEIARDNRQLRPVDGMSLASDPKEFAWLLGIAGYIKKRAASINPRKLN